jgi:Rrf2 family transcriptional regulator, cysteine metabolism repressor
MKISFKCDYALKILLDLACSYRHGITQIKDIAKRQDIPERFLEQIITMLKSAGYIKTVRGPKGGVFLAKDPSKITLGEIVRLMEGPTSPIACVSRTAYGKCDFEQKCVFKPIWASIRDRINDVVDHITFQELAEKSKKLQNKQIIDYVI